MEEADVVVLAVDTVFKFPKNTQGGNNYSVYSIISSGLFLLDLGTPVDPV